MVNASVIPSANLSIMKPSTPVVLRTEFRHKETVLTYVNKVILSSLLDFPSHNVHAPTAMVPAHLPAWGTAAPVAIQFDLRVFDLSVGLTEVFPLSRQRGEASLG